MILNGYVRSASIGQSQNWQCIELKFAARAAGTNWVLIAEQQIAATKVYAVQGNGTADLLTAAQATTLVAGDAGTPRPLNAVEAAAIATDLVTYFTNIPVAADGSKSLAFVVGGLSGLGRVLCAELEWASLGAAAANSSNFLRVAGPSLVCTSATNPVLADTSLISYPSVGVVAGVFTLFDVLDVPAATAPVTLKIWIRP